MILSTKNIRGIYRQILLKMPLLAQQQVIFRLQHLMILIKFHAMIRLVFKHEFTQTKGKNYGLYFT